MKTFKDDQVARKLDKIFCDVCGQHCMKTYDNEYASLSAAWGYDSRKDLTHHNIDLCEDCFDKTIQFLKELRKNSSSGLLGTFANDDPLEGNSTC